MKKFNNYLLRLMAVVAIFGLYSCGDDETEPVDPPSISVGGTDFDATTLTASGQPGTVISSTITATSEAGMNALRISKTGGEAFTTLEVTKTSGEDGPASLSIDFEYTLLAEEVGVAVTFTVTAVEDTDDARFSTETLTIETTSPDARVYTAVLLAPPLGDKSAETFFSTNTGETYSPNEVNATSDPLSADIDFGYFEGSTSGANLASPASFDTSSNAGLSAQTDSWGTINDITFAETDLTSEEFLAITTFADIDAAFDGGTQPTDASIVSGLAVGDVIAFETDADKDGGSKRGVIEVTSITPGDGVNGRIELEIIVQEDAN